ncbi:MAG: phosphate/phosphite/phosphonate ABC transporter substrate-binding protein [Nitrospinota bacterium]
MTFKPLGGRFGQEGRVRGGERVRSPLRAPGPLLALLLASALALAFPPHAPGAGKELSDLKQFVVAFTPQEDPVKLELNTKAFATYLAAELGLPVRTFVAADYAGIIEAMRAGHAQMAFLPSLPYALAQRLAGAEMVMAVDRGGRPFYFSRIFVRAESDIRKLQDLRGKTMAFTDPLSSSGYLFPNELMIRKGLFKSVDEHRSFFKRVFFAGGYEQALRALVSGQADAAAASQFAPARFLTPAERAKIRVLAENGPVPSHGIALAGNLSGRAKEKTRAALAKLNRPEKNAILRNIYGWKKLVPVDSSLYARLVEAARLAGIIEPAQLAKKN